MIIKLTYIVTYLLWFCFGDQVTLSSKRSTADSQDRLVQIISFFRHGAYVEDYIFTEDEFTNYVEVDPPFQYSTYLGHSQSWSFGNELKSLHEDFFSGLSKDDYIFVVGSFLRSKLNSIDMYAAFMGNYPDWNYDNIDMNVRYLIETKGICQGCSEYSAIPISKLSAGLLSNETLLKESTPFEIHEDLNIFDMDQMCSYIHLLAEEFMDNMEEFMLNTFDFEYNEENYNNLIDKMTWRNELKSPVLKDVIVLNENHNLHKLPEVSYLQGNLKKLLNIDNLLETYTKAELEWLFEDKKTARIFSSALMQSVQEKLYGYAEEETKVVTYMSHNSNIYSLYYLLTNSYLESSPDFSSNLVIKVYETNEGGNYITAYYNYNIIDIYDCPETCTVEDFFSILDDLIIENYLDYCNHQNPSKLDIF